MFDGPMTCSMRPNYQGLFVVLSKEKPHPHSSYCVVVKHRSDGVQCGLRIEQGEKGMRLSNKKWGFWLAAVEPNVERRQTVPTVSRSSESVKIYRKRKSQSLSAKIPARECLVFALYIKKKKEAERKRRAYREAEEQIT